MSKHCTSKRNESEKWRYLTVLLLHSPELGALLDHLAKEMAGADTAVLVTRVHLLEEGGQTGQHRPTWYTIISKFFSYFYFNLNHLKISRFLLISIKCLTTGKRGIMYRTGTGIKKLLK
jgi:hypothetical protein